MILNLLKSNSFGLAILACAAVSFAFPAAFTSWGGVKLTKLVYADWINCMIGTAEALLELDAVK